MDFREANAYGLGRQDLTLKPKQEEGATSSLDSPVKSLC